jgi:hypothetical protein
MKPLHFHITEQTNETGNVSHDAPKWGVSAGLGKKLEKC